VEERESRDDGLVVCKPPVAVHLGEFGEQPLHVVERAGPIRMARDLHALPGTEIGEDFGAKLGRARFESARWTACAPVSAASCAGLRFLLKKVDRLLEVEGDLLPWRIIVSLQQHGTGAQSASTSRTNVSLGRMRRAWPCARAAVVHRR
jgi:hypothetical protein